MQRILATILLSAFAVGSASAGTVTLVGDTITYEYDDGQAALALFGAPTIIGDTVRFLPTGFRAESVDGAGSDLVPANFVFDRIYSHSGIDIMKIEVVEFGDYEITNGDSVAADVLLTATSNVNALDFTSGSDSFDATGGTTGLQTWMMSAAVNPEVAFIFAANDIGLSLQNTLEATTDAFGERAWIQKKLSLVATTTIPVPAAVWLFGSALGLLGWMRMRSS